MSFSESALRQTAIIDSIGIAVNASDIPEMRTMRAFELRENRPLRRFMRWLSPKKLREYDLKMVELNLAAHAAFMNAVFEAAEKGLQ